MVRDFGVVILFIVLMALFVGGTTYVAVTDPSAFSLSTTASTQETPR